MYIVKLLYTCICGCSQNFVEKTFTDGSQNEIHENFLPHKLFPAIILWYTPRAPIVSEIAVVLLKKYNFTIYVIKPSLVYSLCRQYSSCTRCAMWWWLPWIPWTPPTAYSDSFGRWNRWSHTVSRTSDRICLLGKLLIDAWSSILVTNEKKILWLSQKQDFTEDI